MPGPDEALAAPWVVPGDVLPGLLGRAWGGGEGAEGAGAPVPCFVRPLPALETDSLGVGS